MDTFLQLYYYHYHYLQTNQLYCTDLTFSSTSLEEHASSVGPQPSEQSEHIKLGPSTFTSNLGPSTMWSLNLVPQLGPSTWTLKL